MPKGDIYKQYVAIKVIFVSIIFVIVIINIVWHLDPTKESSIGYGPLQCAIRAGAEKCALALLETRSL